MTNTRDGLPEEIADELREHLPDLPWHAGARTHGAFHHVIVMPEAAVRVRTGADREARTDAEIGLASLLAERGVPCPRPRGAALHAATWSATVLDRVPGVALPGRDWATERPLLEAAAQALVTVATADTAGLAAALPRPRTWCGGEQWPAIVTRIARALPRPARRRADSLIARLLADEADLDPSQRTLVHGDLGPHNLLVDGERWALIDTDHAAWGDPAIDVAPLIAWYGDAALRGSCDAAVLARARTIRRTLPLQVAAAAELAGDSALRDHALGNFARREHDDPDVDS